MNIFDGIKSVLESVFENYKDDDWIEWVAQPNDWIDDCDKYNGCYFAYKQKPKYPQHLNCQCKLKKITKPIPNLTAFAACDIEKFTNYLFNPTYNDGNKKFLRNGDILHQRAKILDKNIQNKHYKNIAMAITFLKAQIFFVQKLK